MTDASRSSFRLPAHALVIQEWGADSSRPTSILSVLPGLWLAFQGKPGYHWRQVRGERAHSCIALISL